MPSRLPRAKHWSRGTKWLVALGVLLVAGAGSVAGWYVLSGRNTIRPDLLLHPVKKEKLQVTIVERGNLESAENNELTCRVKARAQGSTNAATIRWVIDDGSPVSKGDRVMELDDSGLQDLLTAQQITVDTARGNWLKAEEDYKITLSTNESAIATQVLAIEVNQLTLDEYVQGSYVQSRTDFVGKVTMAQSDLSMWEERAAWSERMSRPGRQYVTTAQAEADHARLLSAGITLKNLEKQLEVLDKLTLKKQQVDLTGKIDEAKRALDRARKEAKSKEVQADVTRLIAKATYEKELAKMRDYEGEIAKCIITAPQSGMVVYYVDERTSRGMGQQSIIAQGETVREGQKLMKIPNLAKMVVEAKVHEAMVPRVRADLTRRTEFTNFVQSGRLLSPDFFGGLLAYASFDDMRTEFKEAHRGAESVVMVPGQSASVRINAYQDRTLKAHVKSVGTVPSKTDWFSADVKVYPTVVAIDEALEGLKPGMDAEVTIYIDTYEVPVLSLPLQAVLGSADMGEKRKCYVINSEGQPEAREVTLGMSNDTMVEVKEGLEEGERVVLNPLVLLSEKEKREYSNQPTRRGRGGRGGSEAPDANGSPDGGAGGPPGAPGGMPKGAGGRRGKGKMPAGGFPKGGFPKGGFPKGGNGAWPKGGDGGFPGQEG
jgi:multidrug efflux pump subunit AcrA (membrane-fusion protein)